MTRILQLTSKGDAQKGAFFIVYFSNVEYFKFLNKRLTVILNVYIDKFTIHYRIIVCTV